MEMKGSESHSSVVLWVKAPSVANVHIAPLECKVVYKETGEYVRI